MKLGWDGRSTESAPEPDLLSRCEEKGSMVRKKAEVVELQPNAEKIIAAISFVIRAASEIEYRLTQYDIVKTIFLADKAHLNKWGRPVTFDNYVAMTHGPVPSMVYDLLKDNWHAKQRAKIADLPWDRAHAGNSIFIFSNARAENVDEVLSPSDMTALHAAFETITTLTFGQIRKLMHEDPAYIDAWEDDGDQGAYPMSLGMFLDAPDFEFAREIGAISKYV